MTDTWANVTKNAEYFSIKRPYNKDEKKSDLWPNIHVSFSEMVWFKEGGSILLLASVADMPSGVKVSKSGQEKLKFPCPMRLALDPKSDSKAELALCKVIESTTEPGKFYSGFLALQEHGLITESIATGLKPDGTAISETEAKFLFTQLFNVMEIEKLITITSEVIALAKKEQDSKGGWGGGTTITMETLEDRYNFRLKVLAPILGMKGGEGLPEALQLWSTVDAKTRDFLKLLLE